MKNKSLVFGWLSSGFMILMGLIGFRDMRVESGSDIPLNSNKARLAAMLVHKGIYDQENAYYFSEAAEEDEVEVLLSSLEKDNINPSNSMIEWTIPK